MTTHEPEPDELPDVPQPGWPGPDRYTLLAMVELDEALDADVRVDAAHAVVSDGVVRAFGPRWNEWLAQALAAEGVDPGDLAALLRDDELAERVVRRMRDRMRADDDAPDLPDEEFGWYAYAPGDPAGSREAFRRAVRRRAQTARHALLAPRRPRVAGRRDER
ncbi:hypothetical protein DQ244_01240 [Blastococcus sp. TBT05-19]|uniref:hypothetical protein n=1 Tax=Blastococcus sp. TBT05-19 TaxID=2250581 RepID=UPI000DEA595C|nr:hypothetical protein [Blastococcus sp. TBT05-19]RBY94024.1 hypothetical protein DQ244_01240 [Blastococcus sp. TBT05-19]